MSLDDLPVTCQMCGEHYPDNDALWDHECPAWEREVRQSRPRLAVYRNVDRWYQDRPKPAVVQRIVEWSLRQMFPNNPEADFMDGLGKLGAKKIRKLEARLVRCGLVSEPEHRSEMQKIRTRLKAEERDESREVGRRSRRA